MRRATLAMMGLLWAGTAFAAPHHDSIPKDFHGVWATDVAECRDPEGVEQVFIDAESVNYYEGNDYLLIGVQFSGSFTNSGKGALLFNGRFTSRAETQLLGESDIRMEIGDTDKNVLYRYAIGEDGEPIASTEVRSIRCK